jgi:hypothetical protein
MRLTSSKALTFLVIGVHGILTAQSFLPRAAFLSLQKTSCTRHHVAAVFVAAKSSDKWNDKDHLIHNASEIHEDTPDELREGEDLAAWDAHDCSDAGMEAASEERALMLAQEIAHKMHEEALEHKRDRSKQNHNVVVDELKPGTKKNVWKDADHLIRGAAEIHEDTAEELRDGEDSAAWDAHDCSDAGMEAASEERALMIAQEMAHKLHEGALKLKQKQQEKKA